MRPAITSLRGDDSSSPQLEQSKNPSIQRLVCMTRRCMRIEIVDERALFGIFLTSLSLALHCRAAAPSLIIRQRQPSHQEFIIEESKPPPPTVRLIHPFYQQEHQHEHHPIRYNGPFSSPPIRPLSRQLPFRFDLLPAPERPTEEALHPPHLNNRLLYSSVDSCCHLISTVGDLERHSRDCHQPPFTLWMDGD